MRTTTIRKESKTIKNKLNKDNLKPGDVIGIMMPVGDGYAKFRYKKVVPMTIERISPARKKFVTSNGWEFSDKDDFYSVENEPSYETRVAQLFENTAKYFNSIDDARRKGLRHMDDEHIIALADAVEKVYQIVSDEMGWHN